jgi:hypothetical protein
MTLMYLHSQNHYFFTVCSRVWDDAQPMVSVGVFEGGHCMNPPPAPEWRSCCAAAWDAVPEFVSVQ